MIRAAALFLVLAGPASANCRQALALGLDVSGSVDAREYRLQIDGLASALDAPEVREALLGQPEAPVRLTVYEWSGPLGQSVLLPWVEITNDAALDAAINQLRGARRRSVDLTTAIGSAILVGFDLLGQQTDCLTRTLDLSGDGQSNTGPRPQDVDGGDTAQGVVVNGLVIGGSDTNGDQRLAEIKELSAYYRAYVIRGIGSFVETALGFEDYETAMRRKLLRELTSLAIGQAESGQDALFIPIRAER